MNTTGTPAPADLHTAPQRPALTDTLRPFLVVAVVLLVIGLVVFAGLSGLAADPMAGT